MTPDKLPSALHGFLRNCGLCVSRGDNGAMNLAAPDMDPDVVNSTLDRTVRDLLQQHKADILALADAEPQIDGTDGNNGDDTLAALARSEDSPGWRDAMRSVVQRIALKKWTSHVGRAHVAGILPTDKSVFVDAETARLYRVCGL
ncbi:MAG TPA: hypothetical protein VH253_10955 [Phycisphaerae bacterium]|nr:hypothetical protein [Phycisphaerae bacterium]